MNELIQKTLDSLVDKVETGSGDWLKEWIGGGNPRNYTTHRNYHGINVLMLWAAGQIGAYPTAEWASYKQWLAAGYQVSKGARSTVIFINKDAVKKGGNADNPEDHYRFQGCAFVFNAAQLENPPQIITGNITAADRIEHCERTLAATGAVIQEGESPLYRVASDIVVLPGIDKFLNAEGYYVTAFHELIHWTSHKSRLDRDISQYANEELAAELGGVFLCVEHGIEPDTDNCAAYLRGWLRKTHGNRGEQLMKAASVASKAAEFITKSRSPVAVAAE